MRECKFKVWIDESEKEKGMYDVAAIHFDDDATYVQPWGKNWQTPNGTLLMYTGSRDKNGKRIYEGDIIKENDSIGRIIYDTCEFRINWKVNKDFYNDVLPRHINYCEVIGNIYENSNLLEQN